MVILERKGAEVYCNGLKLKINTQASKGPGKEVVSVEGLEGSNGQKWISLSRLHEGINEIETSGRQISSYQRYNLTSEESARVKELQSEIDSIIENAKKRYVTKPNLNININNMTQAEKEAKAIELERYIAMLRGE